MPAPVCLGSKRDPSVHLKILFGPSEFLLAASSTFSVLFQRWGFVSLGDMTVTGGEVCNDGWWEVQWCQNV